MIRLRTGMLVIVSGFSLRLLLFSFVQNYNLINLELRKTGNYTESDAGLPGYVAYGLLNLATPLATTFFNMTSHRTVIMIGVILCCTSLIFSALVTNIYMLIFSFGVLFGLGGNFFHITSLHLLIYYYAGKRYSQACAIVNAGIGAGVVVSSMMLEYLFAEFGLQKTLIVFGSCGMVIGLSLSYFMVKPVSDRSIRSHLQIADDKKQDTKEKKYSIDKNLRTVENSDFSTGNIDYDLTDSKSKTSATEVIRPKCLDVCHDILLTNSNAIESKDCILTTEDDSKNTYVSTSNVREKPLTKSFKRKHLSSILKMVKSLDCWLCLPMFFLLFLAVPFTLVGLGGFMLEKGMTFPVIARTLSLMGFVELATRLLYALVATRIPLSTCNIYATMSCLCAVLSTLLTLNLSNDVINALLVALSAPRAFLLMLAVPVCVEVFGKKKSGIAISIGYIFIGTGTLLSQPLLGSGYEDSGSYDTTLHICAVLYTIPAISYWLICFRRRRRSGRKNSRFGSENAVSL